MYTGLNIKGRIYMKRSEGILFALYHINDCLNNDLKIQPEGPVLEVPDIMPHSFLH